jgi:ATP-dependent Clp protease, protease subunit
MSKRLNRDDIDKLYDYGIYIPTKTLITVGDSDEEVASNIMKGLHILDSIQVDTPLTIHLNNCGGDEYHGMAIYDAIKACKSKTIIVGMGNVHSMGSVIFQAANERIMSPNAKQLIHYGTPLLADSDLHAKSQWSWTKECKKFSAWMEQMYLSKIREKNPKFKLKKLQEMLNFDTVLDARESVDYGLADKILGEEDV